MKLLYVFYRGQIQMMMTAIQRKKDSDQSLGLPQNTLLVLSPVSISFNLNRILDIGGRRHLRVLLGPDL